MFARGMQWLKKSSLLSALVVRSKPRKLHTCPATFDRFRFPGRASSLAPNRGNACLVRSAYRAAQALSHVCDRRIRAQPAQHLLHVDCAGVPATLTRARNVERITRAVVRELLAVSAARCGSQGHAPRAFASLALSLTALVVSAIPATICERLTLGYAVNGRYPMESEYITGKLQ